MADVRGQHSLKKFRFSRENLQDAFLQFWLALQRKQQARHPDWTPPQTRMSRGIEGKVAPRDCLGKRFRLLKSKAHAFASNCIHSSGSVAHQRNVSGTYRRQRQISCGGTALNGGCFAICKSFANARKKMESFV